MFNHEQLEIIRDFSWLKGEETTSALLVVLREGRAAVVVLQASHYLFTPWDIGWLSQASGSIEHFLADHGESFVTAACREQELHGLINEVASLRADAFGGRPAIVIVDEAGSPSGYCMLAQLVQAAWRMQLQATAYFQTLLETVSDAVTVVDRSGTVIGWNAVAEEIYGIRKPSIVGRTIGEHFDPEALVVLRILDEGRRMRNTYHRPRPDTHVLINASPIFDERGEIIGGVATEQDITHLVKLNDELTTVHSRLLTHKIGDSDPFALITSRGESMGKVVKIARKVAETDSSVLLMGETGAGKEQLARVIHRASSRAGGPFLSLNCGAIPAGLVESELFGFQGGAFSGKLSFEAGKLEAADGGSLFLNEIECLSMDIQDKLCQFIQRHALARIGGREELTVSTRILAATSEDLEQLVQEGKFRADLFYALNVVSIKVPPLRERKEDLANLVQLYLRVFSLQYQKPIPALSPEVMLAFTNYEWPGNMTELRATIERCVILSENDQITLEHLPEALQQKQTQLALETAGKEGDVFVSGRPNVDGMEKMLRPKISVDEEIVLMKEALERAAGNKSNAAKLLGISRGTLYKKIREYNLV